MKLVLTALLCMAVFAGRTNAQLKPGQVQPDRIDFGPVHVGSTVEGSVLVNAPGQDLKMKFDVITPPFVKLVTKSIEPSPTVARSVCGSVEIAIDTSKVGDFKGDVTIQLGTISAYLPVSALVKPQKDGLLRLLVVETPFAKYSTDDGSRFGAWADLVAKAPWDVHYLSVRNDQPVLGNLKLTRFDAMIVAMVGLYRLTTVDIRRIREFAEGGGTVFLMADHFFRGTVSKANLLLADYGMMMHDEESHSDPQVTVELPGLDSQLLRAGIEKVSFQRASSSSVTQPTQAKVLVKAVGMGHPGDGFVTTAVVGSGRIVVVGQSLWCFWISRARDPRGENAELLRWLLNTPYQRRQRFVGLTQPLSPAQIAGYWTELAAEDPDEALEAADWLSRAPAADRLTPPFLRQQLKPDQPLDPNRLSNLIAKLDDSSFQIREEAQRELLALGEAASPALQKALSSTQKEESRHRLESIIKRPKPLLRDKMRELRAVEVLAFVGTAPAKAILNDLSKGAPGTRLTVAAQRALDRLAARAAESSAGNPGSATHK
jgi:hypothetical protein